MNKRMKRLLAVFLTAVLVVCAVPAAAFADGTAAGLGAEVDAAAEAALLDTADYLYKTVKTPQVGSIGGEWAVLGLARSGYDKVTPQYYSNYYSTVEAYVRACAGVLHEKKYTEYSRLIVALTSIGKDPRNVAGYDLLTPLGDFEKTIWQGINGPIWALIALDSRDYPMPENRQATVQATREMYVDEILRRQLPDGGFSLFGGSASAGDREVADPDITGMALQALAKYQDREDVKKVTREALACLSRLQDKNGGFSSWGSANSESVVQVIVALTELGIPLDDSRFVKNGKTMVDNLLTFYVKGSGFLHAQDGDGSNLMATEQAFYGLAAIRRAAEGKNSLYRMGDAADLASAAGGSAAAGKGLEGKNADVKARDITAPGKTYEDISAHVNQPAVEALASRGIISGYDDGTFRPEATMTRAEFAAIVVNALGLTPKVNGKFSDVAQSEWYAPYIGTAADYGVVSGTSAATFDPEGAITRQEAACMTANAAKLCGMDTAMTESEARDIISQFSDYVKSEGWARPALGFCYKEDILSQSDLKIEPLKAIKRCEIAEMLYRMLGTARLL